MNARAGGVEIPADERCHLGDIIAYLVPEIIGYLGYDGGIHAVEGASERGVFKHHGLKRHVARALADAEQ